MRTFSTICMLLVFASCFNTDRAAGERDKLNERITRLEQRIDSLISNAGTRPAAPTLKSNDRTVSRTIVKQMNRCQAITKKGTQCKRAARSGGYCWQHGG